MVLMTIRKEVHYLCNSNKVLRFPEMVRLCSFSLIAINLMELSLGGKIHLNVKLQP